MVGPETPGRKRVLPLSFEVGNLSTSLKCKHRGQDSKAAHPPGLKENRGGGEAFRNADCHRSPLPKTESTAPIKWSIRGEVFSTDVSEQSQPCERGPVSRPKFWGENYGGSVVSVCVHVYVYGYRLCLRDVPLPPEGIAEIIL